MRYLECTETEIIEGTKTIVIAVPDDMTQEQALAAIGKERLQEEFDEMEYDSSDATETTFEWSDEEPEEEPDFNLTKPLPDNKPPYFIIDHKGSVTQQMVTDTLYALDKRRERI